MRSITGMKKLILKEKNHMFKTTNTVATVKKKNANDKSYN